MPRVPTYDNFQTSISQAPRAQFQAPSGPTGDAIAANNLSQTGQALSQAGGAMAKMALDAATQANQVRVDEALNQLKERCQCGYALTIAPLLAGKGLGIS